MHAAARVRGTGPCVLGTGDLGQGQFGLLNFDIYIYLYMRLEDILLIQQPVHCESAGGIKNSI